MSTPRFATYLRKLQRKHFKRVGDFAAALGVDPTHLSRAMGANSRPFDIYGLFRLAEVTGESVDTVLRMADKGDLADLIITHCGQPTAHTALVREIYDRCVWIESRGSDPEVLQLVRAMLRRSMTISAQLPTGKLADARVPTVARGVDGNKRHTRHLPA